MGFVLQFPNWFLCCMEEEHLKNLEHSLASTCICCPCWAPVCLCTMSCVWELWILYARVLHITALLLVLFRAVYRLQSCVFLIHGSGSIARNGVIYGRLFSSPVGSNMLPCARRYSCSVKDLLCRGCVRGIVEACDCWSGANSWSSARMYTHVQCLETDWYVSLMRSLLVNLVTSRTLRIICAHVDCSCTMYTIRPIYISQVYDFYYRVRKKGATLFLPVSLRNANQFSKFFYCHILQ